MHRPRKNSVTKQPAVEGSAGLITASFPSPMTVISLPLSASMSALVMIRPCVPPCSVSSLDCWCMSMENSCSCAAVADECGPAAAPLCTVFQNSLCWRYRLFFFPVGFDAFSLFILLSLLLLFWNQTCNHKVKFHRSSLKLRDKSRNGIQADSLEFWTEFIFYPALNSQWCPRTMGMLQTQWEKSIIEI